jgi:hypothetical protein
MHLPVARRDGCRTVVAPAAMLPSVNFEPSRFYLASPVSSMHGKGNNEVHPS